jgi:hypothetical protein
MELAKKIKELQSDMNLKDILIAFNNHFAVFGPQSFNDFLKIMEMPESNWKSEFERNKDNVFHSADKLQSSLSDFSHL